jgi:HAD superfamily hydrolase (TIGR01549 family)
MLKQMIGIKNGAAKDLRSRITQSVDKHDVIAFDIFDTLLVRPYNSPGDMFIHLEKIYQLEGFAASRVRAEMAARKKTAREEITYDEIYTQIDGSFKCMYEREIDLEKQTLQANPDIQKCFQYAVEQKKKVVIISDMYLPKSVIEDVLTLNNYTGYDKLYLSSDYFLTKHTGRLFAFVLNDMNVDGRNMLHIGDNYYSDLIMARKNGLHTCLYKKIKNQLSKDLKNAKRYRAKNFQSIGASIILGVLSLWNIKRRQSSVKRNYFEDFGYMYGGPAAAAYMEWLKTRLQSGGVADVLFVARDGYILKKAFDLLSGNSFNTSYIYAPRLINILFLIDYDQDNFFGSIGLSGMKKILHFYKNKDPLLRSGTPADEGLTFCTAKEFIQKNIDLYKYLAQKEKAAYYKYAVSGVHGGKIAVVDSITEKYSAQRLLQELSTPDNISVQGYYWSTLNGGGGGGINVFKGENESLVYNLSLIEFLMTSPEPPVEYLESMLPVYKELSDEERTRGETYQFIAKGIIDYVNDVISIFGGNSVFIAYKDIKNWLNTFIDFPSGGDRRRWRNLKRAASFDHDAYTLIFPEWYEKKMMITKFLFRRLAYSSPNMFRRCLTVLNALDNLKTYICRIIRRPPA